MRHSKSVDHHEAQDDFDRGITERGKNDALNASQSLLHNGFIPSLALVSPSRRTLQTWECMTKDIGLCKTLSPMVLYHASTELLKRVAFEHFETGVNVLIMVGHNPGIGGFAHDFAAQLQAACDLPRGWSTSAVAVFNVKYEHETLKPEALLHCFNPKNNQQ